MPGPVRHFDYLIWGSGPASLGAARALQEQDAGASVGILATGRGEGAGPFGSELLSGRPARISPEPSTVLVDDGSSLHFGTMLLAEQGLPRGVAGLQPGPRVAYLGPAPDQDELLVRAAAVGSVLVVGAGPAAIGIAAFIASAGPVVTLLTPDAVGGSALPADLAPRLERSLADAGVLVQSGATVLRGAAGADEVTLQLEDGTSASAGLAVLALRREPATEVARAAGIAVVADGFVVDRHLRTSSPFVLATWPAASLPTVAPGWEFFPTAAEEDAAGHAAGRIMGGDGSAFVPASFLGLMLPDVRLEAVGRVDASLETVADWAVPFASGVVHYLQNGRPAGVLFWNVDESPARRAAAVQLLAEAPRVVAGDLVGRV